MAKSPPKRCPNGVSRQALIFENKSFAIGMLDKMDEKGYFIDDRQVYLIETDDGCCDLDFIKL